jgi:membrane-associated phospholipid phosphatase
VNEVAALPSLHSAYTLLPLLFFWSSARVWQRVLLVLYPLAMGFSLVYTGEHYVFDIVLGWVYAVAVYALVLGYERWRARARLEEPARAPVALSDSRGKPERVLT